MIMVAGGLAVLIAPFAPSGTSDQRKCSPKALFQRGFIRAIKMLQIPTVEDQSGWLVRGLSRHGLHVVLKKTLHVRAALPARVAKNDRRTPESCRSGANGMVPTGSPERRVIVFHTPTADVGGKPMSRLDSVRVPWKQSADLLRGMIGKFRET